MTAEPPKRIVDSPKVWVSLLSNKKYLTGLLTIDFSLKLQSTKYPFVVLYTDRLEPEAHEALDRRGIPKRKADHLTPSKIKDLGPDMRFYECCTKLQAFALTEFERVVLLDSDMVALQNMDELMDIPLDPTGDRVFASSHACVCNPMKKAHYPSTWAPSNCAYTSQHSNPIVAATEGAPAAFGVGELNSGLLVIQPSMDLFDQIQATLNNPEVVGKYHFLDQSLLSDVFSGRWAPLPYRYNALKTLRWCHKEIWRDEDVKNVHFILTPKPWDQKESDDETHKWWWDINDQRLTKEKEAGIDDGF